MSFLTTLLPAADPKSTGSGNFFQDNFLTIALVLVLVVMVIFMIRNSRKRKRDAEELKNKFVPGAEVMTQHGIYGTLVSVDDEKNEAIIETTPGTRLRVHRQTIARVVEPTEIDPSQDLVEDEPTTTPVAGEPQYGERVDAADEAATSTASATKPRTPRKKPVTDADATE